MKTTLSFWRPRTAAAVLLFTLSLLLCEGVHAADNRPPENMTYQGFLVDGNGQALGFSAPKNYDVIFRIYNSQAGGSLKWSEQQTVTVDKGYFSVLLGEGSDVGSESRPALSTVLSGADASDRFVGMTVKGIGGAGADMDILPRLRLLTAPYAFLARQAATVDGAGVSSGTVADGRLSTNVALRIGGNTFTGNQLFNNNVGVGTTNSLGKLAVKTTTAGYGLVHTDDTITLGTFIGAGGAWLGTYSPNPLHLFVGNGQPSLTVNANGNVGMGTTNPSAKLHVAGEIKGDGNITSPKFNFTDVMPGGTGNWSGRTATFTSGGGKLVITVRLSGFSPSVGLKYPLLGIDNPGGEGMYAAYIGEANKVITLPVFTVVKTGVAAGTHTLKLIANDMSVDANCYSQVTVLELPF